MSAVVALLYINQNNSSLPLVME